MKTLLIVVWLLSNGQFQGEPWIEFDDHQTCMDKANSLALSSDLDNGMLLFLTGCIDKGTGAAFTGMSLELLKGHPVQQELGIVK